MPDEILRYIDGQMGADGRKFTIVVARWNELITKELLEGALDELRKFPGLAVTVIRVPGTWELPVVVQAQLSGSSKPDAVIALGCILMGETAHGDLLAKDVSSALMKLQIEHAVPVTWGVLTPANQQQALDRAGIKMGNKGREAASAAVEMADLLAKLRQA